MDSARIVRPLFHAAGGGLQPTSALHLTFDIADLGTSRALIRLWHSRLPRLDRRVSGWLAFGAEGPDGLYYAAAVWGWPVARNLPQDGSCLELRRFAIAPDAPRFTASRMLGWMARRLMHGDVTRLVSYQDAETHTGTIYKAAGWEPHPCDRGGSWAGRRNQGVAPRVAVKVRWERKNGRASQPPPEKLPPTARPQVTLWG